MYNFACWQQYYVLLHYSVIATRVTNGVLLTYTLYRSYIIDAPKLFTNYLSESVQTVEVREVLSEFWCNLCCSTGIFSGPITFHLVFACSCLLVLLWWRWRNNILALKIKLVQDRDKLDQTLSLNPSKSNMMIFSVYSSTWYIDLIRTYMPR